MEPSNPSESPSLTNARSVRVRQRWLDLFEISHFTRRVSHQEIEPGMHAVMIPSIYGKDSREDLVEIESRAAARQVPSMARGLLLRLQDLGELGLSLPAGYREWMGPRGEEIARGDARVTAFVDLAYLEAALVERLCKSDVQMDFGSPLAVFRRGALIDYANIYAAAVAMVLEGHSLSDTAGRLVPQVLRRLQCYANAYLHLSFLYRDLAWHIDRDTFVVQSPCGGARLALSYWELRGDGTSIQKALAGWRGRIEAMRRHPETITNQGFPASFAA